MFFTDTGVDTEANSHLKNIYSICNNFRPTLASLKYNVQLNGTAYMYNVLSSIHR
jgi:hypothetical protein